MPTGNTQVTGRLSGALGVPGSFDTILADVPTEAPRRDPWLLFSLAGHPGARRRDRRSGRLPGRPARIDAGVAAARPPRLGRGERSAAEWSGRIGSEIVALDEARECTVAVAWDPDVCQLTVTDAQDRPIVVRRDSPGRRVRVCRTDGCRPGLEVHAPTADITLVFETGLDRDRMAASIE